MVRASTYRCVCGGRAGGCTFCNTAQCKINHTKRPCRSKISTRQLSFSYGFYKNVSKDDIQHIQQEIYSGSWSIRTDVGVSLEGPSGVDRGESQSSSMRALGSVGTVQEQLRCWKPVCPPSRVFCHHCSLWNRRPFSLSCSNLHKYLTYKRAKLWSCTLGSSLAAFTSYIYLCTFYSRTAAQLLLSFHHLSVTIRMQQKGANSANHPEITNRSNPETTWDKTVFTLC